MTLPITGHWFKEADPVKIYSPATHRHIFQPAKDREDFCTWDGYPDGITCGFEKDSHPDRWEEKRTGDNGKATDRQVGGDHYSRNKIQPIDYIVSNDLDWFQGNVVKYITRFKHKGERQDLEKVIHYAQLAIQHYYPEEDN